MRKPSEHSSFRKRILQTSTNNFSRIILALDLQGSPPGRLLRFGRDLVERTAPYLCAVKIGRPTILNLGMDRTRRLLKSARALDLPSIIDDKLGDIDDVNSAITRAYFDLGFDGIIVNPIVGWVGGLEPVFKIAQKEGNGVIVLAYMSNPGAAAGFGQLVVKNSRGKPRPQYEIFAEKAEEWHADGVVVGATRPEIVRKVRSILTNGIDIYSPGIGTQGGKIRVASRAGSNFLIVGRSITKARDPETVSHSLARESTIEYS
ncbi:MAG TPA: orotidine 5'-phosphate decarboxylase / HUMPS family protein [Candidatus Bathyarchaeia archaeon]|nr:orotidine 5'-phosphate decarboxylase / HUMPS family protein [Candidatus Bathyarchaeia archaeon]